MGVKGSKFWQMRAKHGRDKIFKEPTKLWDAACEYFKWCDENPLKEEKVFGTGFSCDVDKMRPYTITGLCFFIGCDMSTWNDYKNNHKAFTSTVARVEQVIYTQKFEGAAAGLLNANIISRDLGLIDRREKPEDAPAGAFENLMSRIKNKSND